MTPLQLASIRAHDDITTLLQLACLKHTGQYLPLNCGNSTAWTFTLEIAPDTYEGKRRGKFNPYVDNLLTNPFKSLSDTHPIQHKIMREVLHAELREAFHEKVSIDDIIKALTNSDAEVGGLTEDERRALIWARLKIIQQSEFLLESEPTFYEWINEGTHQRHPTYNNKRILILALTMLALINPSIDTVMKKLNAKLSPSTIKIQKKLSWWRANTDDQFTYNHNTDTTTKVYPPTPKTQKQHRSDRADIAIRDRFYPSPMPASHPYGKRDSLGDKCINEITTCSGCPIVKKDTWYAWFIYHATYNHKAADDLSYAHRKRSTQKINWWDFIKKESGEYKPPNKSKHEERLIQSILSQ